MIKNEDIIKPLVFLDIFDYPPTAMELWRFLGVPAELGEVMYFLSKERHPRAGGDPEFGAVKLDSLSAGRQAAVRGNDSGFYYCHAVVSHQRTLPAIGAF